MGQSSFMPGSTLIMNSNVGDSWVRQACQQNPTRMSATHEGMIETGPVRLAFCDTLFEPKAPQNQPMAQPKYSCCALYTPFTDMNVFYAEYYRVCGEMFREYFNPHINGYSGLENPFHDCATKAHKFEGFTPGLTYINHATRFKIPIVDNQMNPIIDKSKVYPGVWAILLVNAYGYGKSPPQPKKGVSFGLQAVLIMGDDMNLSGGGVDPRQVFANVKVQPPTINPGALGGLALPGQPGAPPMSPPMGPPTNGAMRPPPPPQPLYRQPVEEDISSLY